MSDKSLATVVSVALIGGEDAKVAAQLQKGFRDSQNAGRRIMAFGLFAWEVKTQRLKHGQWGPWLAEHAPELSRVDDKTGKPKAISAVSTYMQMTKDVLEDMGFSVEDYFKHLAKFPRGLGICRDGKFLLAAPKKLPKEVAEIKQQICDRVDGKTVKQIRLGFSQVEEDEETGELKTKRGRLRGEGGVSKEQREAAKERAERERIEDLAAGAAEHGEWVEEFCDDKNGGLIDPAKFAKFAKRIAYAHHYCQGLLKARKGN